MSNKDAQTPLYPNGFPKDEGNRDYYSLALLAEVFFFPGMNFDLTELSQLKSTTTGLFVDGKNVTIGEHVEKKPHFREEELSKLFRQKLSEAVVNEKRNQYYQ